MTSVMSDAKTSARVRGRPMRPDRATGRFRVRVTTRWHGRIDAMVACGADGRSGRDQSPTSADEPGATAGLLAPTNTGTAGPSLPSSTTAAVHRGRIRPLNETASGANDEAVATQPF